MHIETLKAKKYYGRHAVGSVVLVNGHISLHAPDIECKTFVRVLEGSLIPTDKPVCGVCSCKSTCEEQKPFLLGTMESAAVMVVTDKELNERVVAGEIVAFRMLCHAKTSGPIQWYYEQSQKLPRDHNRMMYVLCQVPIMEIVHRENRWKRKSARRA
jgi:hypothetical protein